METLKSGWDLLLWPRSWHKRLKPSLLMLIPAAVIVGLFDVFGHPYSIMNDHILRAESGFFSRIVLFILISALIGVLDVFLFAWPIADLCRTIAKRKEKYIARGFNIILMKSYAYSHLMFLPVLLLVNPTGLQIESMSVDTPFFTQLIIIILIIVASMQFFWQLGVMLRTVSVKSKLDLSGKLIVGAAIFIWSSLEGEAVRYLISVAYQLFGNMDKIS